MDNCRKFCPVESQLNESVDVINLATAIKTCMDDELDRTSQMLREMKCVRVTSPKKAEKRNRENKKAARSQHSASRKASTSTRAKSKRTASKLPKKRGRPAKAKSKKRQAMQWENRLFFPIIRFFSVSSLTKSILLFSLDLS